MAEPLGQLAQHVSHDLLHHTLKRGPFSGERILPGVPLLEYGEEYGVSHRGLELRRRVLVEKLAAGSHNAPAGQAVTEGIHSTGHGVVGRCVCEQA